VKAIVGRLRRLEDHLAAKGLASTKYFQMVVYDLACKRSLRQATYTSQLWPDGTIMESIDLGGDPDARVDVSDEELEAWIRQQREATGTGCETAR